jgi:DNA-binding response OmpR family regulator
MDSATLNILLVEDQPEEAFGIREKLSKMSISVNLIEVRNLAEAAKHLCSATCPKSVNCAGNFIDLVILDLHLPNGKGLACITALRKICRGVSLVVLTEQTDEEIPEYFTAGADDFLEMGSSQRQLEAVIYRSGRSALLKRQKKKKWGTISKQLSVLERITDTLVAHRADPISNS